MVKRIVLVTTDKDRRGVFCGELLSEKGSVVELKNARMAVYWSTAVKGVLGLASLGPQKGSRITPKVSRIKLNGVTSISDCTKKAIENWEKEPWD